MSFISVTLATYQDERLPLKELAPLNMAFMLVTCAMSQDETLPLKVVAV
jgi:hypothetical protein